MTGKKLPPHSAQRISIPPTRPTLASCISQRLSAVDNSRFTQVAWIAIRSDFDSSAATRQHLQTNNHFGDVQRIILNPPAS
ncbi:MAG: hypothetical protein ACKO0N_17965, partial [Planctomycetota bacterium]